MTRTSASLLTTALLATVFAIAPHQAWSAWPIDPAVNVPLCTLTGDQLYPTSVSDGAGGTIITWQDARNGASNLDIYAQRISATGTLKWTTNGVALCTATGNQSTPTIASDGAGGAIVTWFDYRGGATADIYAQRISAAGTVQWTANGVTLCTATGNQSTPTIASASAGGAIVTWQDYRGGANYDIYAQRISAAGAVQWTTNGLALCAATGNQQSPTIASDGAGGAIVTWYDYRVGATADIYAQRISAAGTAQWTANGVAMCAITGDQLSPNPVSDGAGGAIVTWYDNRSGTSYDIYAQRISAAGAVQWTANGVALCTATGDQWTRAIVSDGAAGAIVAWWDYRGGATSDIYAQRISAAGTVQWTANGAALCTATGGQEGAALVSDGLGGAIVTWTDGRGGGNILVVYAQKILASGAVQWIANGVALSTAAGGQYQPTVVADGMGGAIATWFDNRNGNYDIYAQRVDRWGYLGGEPTIVSVSDVPNDQGGKVLVLWSASCRDSAQALNISDYTLWRRVTTTAAQRALARGALLVQSGVSEGGVPRAGAIRASIEGTETVYWEYITSVPARGASGYGYTATTTTDSMPGLIPYNVFFVDAQETSASAFHTSIPDSGYSVDNLAPLTPAPFTGQYAAGTATLHWAVSTATDLGEYRLYRGSTADFVPGPANLVVAQPDTGYVDAAGTPSYYKLCAVDVHGNVSGFSTLLPSGTVDVPGVALPRAVFLAPPAPNPARGATTLRFGLPRPARVELALYDQQGRRVRSLLAGTQPAGERAIAWDGSDDGGRALPAGLYFVRLATEGRTFVSRLAVIR